MYRHPFFAMLLGSLLVLWAVVSAAQGQHTDGQSPDEIAQSILAETGLEGGLIVHLGCGDGRLTTALRAGGRYLVQGLDANAGTVEKARDVIRELGHYGPVSVDEWQGSRLPYADNLVNLLVVGVSPATVDRGEILRVLAPGGVAMFVDQHGVETAGKLTKPWPADIDQWTHHLHDSGGNAVARDKIVGPPRHLQWSAGPTWARSHGWTPSVSAMVSAGGRLFYLCDETLTGIDGTVPDKWFLTARNAFSGVLLWKLPVPRWGSEPLSGTPGTGAGSTTGRFTMPPNIGKRLVAVDDTVYFTFGAGAPITALDAATGQTRQTYAQTAGADEILCTEGRLVATVNPAERPESPAADRRSGPPPAPPPAPGKRVCAVDAESGKMLWNRGPFAAIRATRTQDPFGRLELAAGDGRVFVLTDRAVEALSLETGDTLWRIERPALPEAADRRLGFAGVYEFLLSVMVYHDGVVLLAQPEPNSPHSYHTVPGTLYAFNAGDGQQLWKHHYGAWGHCTQPDIFVVGGVVWTHMDVPAKFSIAPNGWVKVPDTGSVDYRIQGLDLRTGEVRQELPSQDLFDVGHHHRCYRNKITERFMMASRRGVEFVDFASGENYQNHWVRSGCLLGNLPCNGMLYVAPHSCSCYQEVKLTGFNALASARQGTAATGTQADGSAPLVERLVKGPAFGGVRPSELAAIDSRASTSGDWPMYRHDPFRSGATDQPLGADLEVAWQASVGGRTSAPVVAGGQVFVSGVDSHSVHALDAANGSSLWTYTAGARVASPPAVHEGLAIFGGNDGRVVALRAADGALAWRFDAAPHQSRITIEDQLESPWPVPGVLVQDGKCWFAAGRSSYVDGGLHVFALAPATGEVLHEETVYSPDPETGKMAVSTDPHKMPGALNDIPAGDGTAAFVRNVLISPSASDSPAGSDRVYSTAGYLDSSWFNRTYWRSGGIETSGLMVRGPGAVFGMELYESRSRETVFRPGTKAYRLVRHSLETRGAKAKAGKAKKGKQAGPTPDWEQHVAIRVTALIRAGETIFAAGSPDDVDPSDPHGAWEGRRGGVLAAFSAADGRQLSELRLPAPPVWDGMAAAGGGLYVSLENGQVLCLKGQ